VGTPLRLWIRFGNCCLRGTCSMNYFTTVGENGFECVQFLREEDLHLMMSLDGRLLLPGWVPPVVRLCPADEAAASRHSDFPFFAPWTVIIRSSAQSVLAEMCDCSGEWLPLHSADGATLHALNVTRVMDALDTDSSEITYFPGTSRIMFMKKASFKESVIRGVDVFRLPGVASDVYVSENFVQAVKTAKLSGIRFRSA